MTLHEWFQVPQGPRKKGTNMFMRMKYLGLVLLALTAFGCASAGAASARVVHDFTATKSPVILTGEHLPSSPIEYRFGAKWTLKCSLNKLNGTQSLPSSQLTVEPTSSNCLLNEMAATMNYQGCRYVFSGETSLFEHGNLTIECGLGSKILVEVTGCRLEIGPQIIGNGVGYRKTAEKEAPKDVDVILTGEGGSYSKSGLLCATIGGTGSDLGIFGTYTMQAWEDNSGKEGSQVDFTYETTILP
jgi:ribosomal protein S27E